jgi:hypothetical protein
MDTMYFALYNSRDNADRAINELSSHGLTAQNISVIMKENKTAATNEVAERVGSGAGGAVSGAVTGAVVGGVAGLIIGTGVIPGLVGLAVAGPIATALGLTGAAATTATGATIGAGVGGLLGLLTGLGFSETDAERFSTAIDEGGVLLAVPTRFGDVEDVRTILEATGADTVKEVNMQSRMAMA